MKEQKSSQRLLAIFSILISLYYSGFLVSLPIDVFFDRPNYLGSLENANLIFFQMMNKGVISFLMNEPIWRTLNVGLTNVLDPETSLKVIIAFSSFFVSYFLLRESPKNIIIVIVFLFFPLLIKNFIIHLRQGVAISIFLIGYLNREKKIGKFLILTSAMIHSSFIIVIGQLIAFRFISYRRFSFGVGVMISIVLSVILFALIPILADSLGARQSEHFGSDIASIPIFGVIIWGFLATFFIYDALCDKKNKENSLLGVYLIMFYIVGSCFSVLASRIFESNIVLIFLLVLSMKQAKIRRLSECYIFFVGIILWMMSFDGHYFGMAPQ